MKVKSKRVTKADLEQELIISHCREGILLEGLERIKRYVSSSKFHEDRNVNVSDILLRIEEIKNDHFVNN